MQGASLPTPAESPDHSNWLDRLQQGSDVGEPNGGVQANDFRWRAGRSGACLSEASAFA
jgi:hypothetical protein